MRTQLDVQALPTSLALSFQKGLHGIYVSLDLRGNVLCVQVRCRHAAISGSLSGLIEVLKQRSRLDLHLTRRSTSAK